MSHYVDTVGRKIDPAIAAFADGSAKPGYRKILGPGDYASFDISLMDRRPSIFLTDSGISDAAIKRDVAYARMVHNQQYAYLGDRAPTFNEAGAEAAARARGGSGQGRGTSATVTDQAATDAAYSAMCNDLRDAWRRDRNDRVTNAYRG